MTPEARLEDISGIFRRELGQMCSKCGQGSSGLEARAMILRPMKVPPAPPAVDWRQVPKPREPGTSREAARSLVSPAVDMLTLPSQSNQKATNARGWKAASFASLHPFQESRPKDSLHSPLVTLRRSLLYWLMPVVGPLPKTDQPGVSRGRKRLCASEVTDLLVLSLAFVAFELVMGFGRRAPGFESLGDPSGGTPPCPVEAAPRCEKSHAWFGFWLDTASHGCAGADQSTCAATPAAAPGGRL